MKEKLKQSWQDEENLKCIQKNEINNNVHMKINLTNKQKLKNK